METINRKFQKFWRRKKQFLFFLTLCSFAYFLSLPLLTSYFPELVQLRVYQHITVAWCLALSQFIFVGIIALSYYFVSKRFDQDIAQLTKEHRNKH